MIRRDRRFALLIGLGLLVVGLLGGVLATLWLRPAGPSSVVVADRIVPRTVAAQDDSLAPAMFPDLAQLNVRFRQVANAARSAVVFVEVESRAAHFEWLRHFRGEGRQFEVPQQSIGSGVIISSDGYVLTNHHVVQDAGAVSVTLSDRRQYEVEVVGIDRATDLAVLRIKNATGLPAIALGDSDGLEVGEWVLAVGNPFRLRSTVTAGIVSALGREVNIIDDAFSVEDFIQTDAAINPGNSGGALVNLRGELVGIATAIATEGGSYEGYGFAVPSNLALRVATDLISGGRVERGFLGVSIADVSPRQAARLGLDRVGGVLVRGVPEGSVAYRAGLRVGDVITHVGARPVDATNELQSAILRYRPGDEVPLVVRRRGAEQRVVVALISPDDPAYSAWFEQREAPGIVIPDGIPEHGDVLVPDGWGVGLRELGSEARTAFGLEDGAYVAYVERGSVADFAGLPRDVVVLGIEGVEVTSAQEATYTLEALAGREPVLLRVRRRDGTTAFYEVTPPAR